MSGKSEICVNLFFGGNKDKFVGLSAVELIVKQL